MRLYAKQPCSFCGEKFLIGEEIPLSHVHSPKDQEKRGVIAIVSDDSPISVTGVTEAVKFKVMVHAEEGSLPLQVTNEELSVFTDILQIDVSKTADKKKVSDIVQKIESNDLLIMLDALDGRKFVREEVHKRAAEINPQEDKTGGDE